MSAVGEPQPITPVRRGAPCAAPAPHASAAAVSGPINVSMTEELDRIYREFGPVIYRTA